MSLVPDTLTYVHNSKLVLIPIVASCIVSVTGCNTNNLASKGVEDKVVHSLDHNFVIL